MLQAAGQVASLSCQAGIDAPPRGAAVLTIGAGTLADMYEPHERGTVLGIYYAAPLLGPSLGPIIGGGKCASIRGSGCTT